MTSDAPLAVELLDSSHPHINNNPANHKHVSPHLLRVRRNREGVPTAVLVQPGRPRRR